MGTSGLYRIAAASQKVGLGDSTPRHCNQVRPGELGSVGVVTVTYPVSIHLMDLNREEDIILKQVVKLQVGEEGGPLGVEGDGHAVEDVAATYSCLHIKDITDKKTLVGGWHMVQEPGDCGECFERKSSRKGELTGKSGRRRRQPWCSAARGNRTQTG